VVWHLLVLLLIPRKKNSTAPDEPQMPPVQGAGFLYCKGVCTSDVFHLSDRWSRCAGKKILCIRYLQLHHAYIALIPDTCRTSTIQRLSTSGPLLKIDSALTTLIHGATPIHRMSIYTIKDQHVSGIHTCMLDTTVDTVSIEFFSLCRATVMSEWWGLESDDDLSTCYF
jgi:hypothetical protein